MSYIYLDYASTTPMDIAAKNAMEVYFFDKFGNPGSLHGPGQEAIKAVDFSREKIAKAVNADFREIIFTGSATESNNTALRGTVKAFMRNSGSKAETLTPKIIVSAIEHESVIKTARDMELEGVELVVIPVNKNGLIDIKKLENSLDENTVLVSIIYANNEIGAVQPIAEISRIIKDFKKSKLDSDRADTLPEIDYPLFHTDAVQAFQFLSCNVDELGVDLMSFSSHKIYGPKGIGALYIRQTGEAGKTNKINPVITGGNQEFGFRAGTENVPSIFGFAKAVELAVERKKKEAERIADLRKKFWDGIKNLYPKVETNPSALASIISGESKEKESPEFLPNILNVHFPGKRADELLVSLDMAGIAVSSGSACSSRSVEPSHVLNAIGLPKEKTSSAIRFSLGAPTTEREIDEALKRMEGVLK